MKAKTITLVRPEDVATFEVGESWSIDDFDYPTACAIFGQPLVDEWLARKYAATVPSGGSLTVTSIDSDAGVVTFDQDPRRSTSPQRGSDG